MKGKIALVVFFAIGCSVLLQLHSLAAESGDIRTHADRSFDQLNQQTKKENSPTTPSSLRQTVEDRNSYASDQYLVGKGQGNMAQGPIICQRVSELSARTDLAKQIRVLVKERMVDRVRERTGREAEQDIELTREEVVQEYLQGVKIVDRHIDEASKTCSATAVMPKNQIQPNPASDRQEPTR